MTKRRTRLIPVLVGAAALVLLASSTSVAVVRATRDEPATAEALLAEARRFAVESRTVSFRAETRQESNFGEVFGEEAEEVPPEEATTVVNRGVIEGIAVDPDRTRTVTRSGGFLFETLSVGDELWTRFAESDDELADRKWTASGADGSEEGPSGRGDGFGGFQGPGAPEDADAGNVIRLIDRAVAPTIVARADGETVVRADLVPRAEAPTGFKEVNRGSAEFTLADGGRPVRTVVNQILEIDGSEEFDIPGFTVDYRLDQTYSGWGEPVSLEAPAEADVDRTPSVEEEAIAEFTDAPLLQPKGIPEGWVLGYADVIPDEFGDTGCDEVEIEYTDPDDEDYGYLYLYESSIDCADREAPPGSQPFTAGPNRGWVESDDDGYLYAQIVVGRTVIGADTDLSVASLRRVLSQLEPLDLSREPDPITGLTSSVGTPA